ncbi:DUF6207 family protein [Streptomyces sp. V4I23]|uniref:DUF6207 family protein n=1 Tax=Streptomyces sp. V4I23 TaxID=3042282 RepID=UPI0027D8D4F7|nr:DUF6207 family protein [Streptomyces sp. V4I23]
MQVDEQHIAEPGLLVLDITAADEDTVRAMMDGLRRQWATSGITPVWRTPCRRRSASGTSRWCSRPAPR